MDGALVLFGGALLLTPGFLSDVLGVLVLLPPTRAVIRVALVRRFAARMTASAAAPRAGGARARRAPSDVEGTAIDLEPDGLEDRPSARRRTT